MSTRLLGMLAAAAVVIGSAHSASPSTLSLDEAFQRICVATDAKPLEIEKAIIASGGHETSPAVATGEPLHMTAHPFEILIDGEKASAGAGALSMPARIGHHGMSSESCDIITYRKNDPAIAAIRAWAGVQGVDIAPGVQSYNFVTTPSGHAAVPADREQALQAERDGRLWTLNIMRAQFGDSLMLFHHLGSPDPI